MNKHYVPYVIYIILSILAIFFSRYTGLIVGYIVSFYQLIDTHLAVFFSTTSSGLELRHIFTLVVCPLIITGIPAMVYRYIKGSPMPYFLEATWLVWILLVLSNLFTR